MSSNQNERLADVLLKYIWREPLTEEEKQVLHDYLYQDLRMPATKLRERQKNKTRRWMRWSWPWLRLDAWTIAAFMAPLVAILMVPLLRPSDSIPKIPEPPRDYIVKAGEAFLIRPDGSWINLDSLPINARIGGTGGYLLRKREPNCLVYTRLGSIDEDSAGDAWNILITGPGRAPFLIRLADETTLWVGESSRLYYALKGLSANRLLSLKGIAYLQIATDPHNPCTVVLPNGNAAKVLGTDLFIDAQPYQVPSKVSLYTGKVRLINAEREIDLQPGQQAAMGSYSFEVTTRPDPNGELRWIEGAMSFNFQSTDVKVVLERIAAWYGYVVQYADSLPRISITATESRTQTFENLEKKIAKLLESQQVYLRVHDRTIIASTKTF